MCLFPALLFALAGLTWGIDVSSLPKPTGYVSDLAHVVNPADQETLEAFCTRVDQELGVQLALVTVDTVDDRPIRDVALEIARKWGVGDKKNNEGVLLLLAVKDRKSDIETGRGTEPYITDGFAGGTLRSMRPGLRAANYGPALLAGAQEMARQIAQGKGIAFSGGAPIPPRATREEDRQRSGRGIPFPLIVIGLLFFLFLLSRRGGGGRGGGGGGSFLTGMLLGNLLGGGRGGGGNWGGGGGFGGGSNGGGGFGGFGGGDFGGGGASSDW